jgi:hypothetical protein
MQRINPYQPIISVVGGSAPLTLRLGIPNDTSISEGVPASGLRGETYVLMSALPDELRARVETTIQVLLAGG